MRRTPTPEPYFLQTAISSSGVHSPEKLDELIVKMKIWESALLNHFEDRIGDADSLALDPMWSRLMQVSTTTSRYLLSANLPSRYLLFAVLLAANDMHNFKYNFIFLLSYEQQFKD